MANDMNIVTLVGRTTREMEVSCTPGGLAVGKFGIAVNKRKKAGDAYIDYANFFEVVMYGKLVDTLKPYMKKGIQVSINGDLNQERWTDSSTNQQRSKVYIQAEKVQLLKGSNSAEEKPAAANTPAAETHPDPKQERDPQMEFSGGPEDFPDRDIPF